jgi:DNA-binding transcriptional ArsR family regulator
MGTTKHFGFEKEINEIAEICKALGHPARIQILTLLLIKNKRTCGEIVAILPLAQSTVSKQLLELKKAKLVNVENIGKKTIYSLDKNKIVVLKKFLKNYLANISKIEEADKATLTLVPTTKMNKESKLYLKKYNYKFPDRKKTKLEK